MNIIGKIISKSGGNINKEWMKSVLFITLSFDQVKDSKNVKVKLKYK